jgi:hypothetical protein
MEAALLLKVGKKTVDRKLKEYRICGMIPKLWVVVQVEI